MKYLTKEWYETMQRTHQHLHLKPSEEARAFSEEYFQTLYAEKENEYLESERSMCDIDLTELVGALINAPVLTLDPTTGKPSTDAEPHYADDAAKQRAIKAAAKIPPRVFDPEKAKADYHKRYLRFLANAQRQLPPEIINKIADLRVYALGYAAPEIIEEIAAYCKSCEQSVDQTLKNWYEQKKRLFPEGSPSFFEDTRWDEYSIKSSYFQENNLILEPRRPHTPSYIFKDAEILLQERPLAGTFIIYHEIYPLNPGYEIHLLLDHWPDGVHEIFELTLRCSDLISIQS